MCELPHKLPNDLRLRITAFSPQGGLSCPHKKKRLRILRKLGNFKKIPEMLGFNGEFPAVHPKAKFWRFLVKNCKKSAVEHSIEKPILLNFVNLSPTFCPKLWQGMH